MKWKKFKDLKHFSHPVNLEQNNINKGWVQFKPRIHLYVPNGGTPQYYDDDEFIPVILRTTLERTNGEPCLSDRFPIPNQPVVD